MFEFEKPRIDVMDISEDGTYGKFVVEPLERGYGTTLGNSLRRIMLSSLPGAAISSIKIDSVLHEFTTVHGIKEDVSEMILNLKNVAVKAHTESDEPKTAYIEFEGEGVVRAATLKWIRIMKLSILNRKSQPLAVVPTASCTWSL